MRWALAALLIGVFFASGTQATAQSFNREEAEKNMRRAMPPNAICERQGQRSICKLILKFPINYVFFIDYEVNEIKSAITSGENSPSDFQRDLDSLILFVTSYGFSSDQVKSCLYYPGDPRNLVHQLQFVGQKAIINCESDDVAHGGFVSINIKPNTRF